MRLSSLKHELDMLLLTQKYEVDMLKFKHETEKQKLTNVCKHVYDDGSSARTTKGDQRESWYVCEICGKTI